MTTNKKLEKLKEINKSIDELLIQMETRMFIENINTNISVTNFYNKIKSHNIKI